MKILYHIFAYNKTLLDHLPIPEYNNSIMKPAVIEYTVNRKTGKALHDYQMIANGDRVLVAVSGQDSLALLNILKARASYVPIKYKLIAVHINLNPQNARVIAGYLKKMNIEYHILQVDLKKGKKDLNKTPCFWCAWKRREAIFKLAKKLKCKKIAFAHHLDDIIETYLLNIFFQGQIRTMPPKLKMFGGEFHLIRPFAYLEKRLIEKYAALIKIPPLPYPCPYGDKTNRFFIRWLIRIVKAKQPKVKETIYRSMSKINKMYLPTKDI